MKESYNGQKEYAQREDTVPALLTEGEAVIPAPAAQDPKNKPLIEKMIREGREANHKFQMMNDGGYVDDDGIQWHWLGPQGKKQLPEVPQMYNEGTMQVPEEKVTMMASPLMGPAERETAKFMMEQRRKDEMHELNMALKIDAHNAKYK
jgi:hypothetical protein